MAKGYRQGRLGEEIRRIVSDMLMNEIKDPRLAGRMVSITGVEVTSDNSYATCYYTVLSPSAAGTDLNADADEAVEQERREVAEGLKKASGLIRREVGREIKIRRVPELIFKLDTSMEYGRHIDKVIRELEIAPESDEDGTDEEE
ncbi:MAG: 30S ribosome-binding factor RbfA [Eubacterium sp.]|nr:30S ribosome-binding factor RbfA [Eubacterium sp.]